MPGSGPVLSEWSRAWRERKPSIEGPDGPRRRVVRALCVIYSALRRKRGSGGRVSRPQGQAHCLQPSVDASPLRLVRRGAGEIAAVEIGIMTTRRKIRERPGPGRMRREVDSEKGKLALNRDARAKVGLFPTDAEAAFSLGTTEARRSLLQKGAATDSGVTITARAPEAPRALAINAFSRRGDRKANSVSRW